MNRQTRVSRLLRETPFSHTLGSMTTILLAAGLSERMGKNKLLLPFDGKTVIEKTLLSILPFSGKIIVVTGHERQRIEERLRSYPVTFAFNPDYMLGQRGSTLKGLECVDDDDFAILPSDLPLLQKEDVRVLIGGLEKASVVRPVYSSLPGHPVIYRRSNLRKLLSYEGTMKEYLKKEGCMCIPSSIGTVYDVDTPSRYDAVRAFNGDLSVLKINPD